MDYEKAIDAKMSQYEVNKRQAMVADREMSVGELIDRKIIKAERTLKSLYDLKGSLPSNFLNSGASRISAFIEL